MLRGVEIGFYAGLPAGKGGKQPVDGFARQFHGHHAAVEHVLTKDPGETFAHHQVDAVDFKGPGGVFAGAATAEIGPGDDDLLVGDILRGGRIPQV